MMEINRSLTSLDRRPEYTDNRFHIIHSCAQRQIRYQGLASLFRLSGMHQLISMKLKPRSIIRNIRILLEILVQRK